VNCCNQAWLLKNSILLKITEIWGIENVYPNGESRLEGFLMQTIFGHFPVSEFFQQPQAVTLKFRVLSIHFTSESLESGRKMSEMGIYRHLSSSGSWPTFAPRRPELRQASRFSKPEAPRSSIRDAFLEMIRCDDARCQQHGFASVGNRDGGAAAVVDGANGAASPRRYTGPEGRS
jgi:hypothetical protein